MPGDAERSHQPERDRLSVGKLETGRGLERVRERVAEVQPLPDAAVVGVAQAQRRLVGGRAADVELEAG